MSSDFITEKYGPSGSEHTYTSRNGVLRSVSVSAKGDQLSWFVSIKQAFWQVFLPQGYPDSVSSDYLSYQLWDTLQALASSVTGTLAGQAVLKGVGVGDSSATVLGATLTWMLKDGTGMVGRILFAWSKGTFLDCDCKRWRLFADILNDGALFLELIAPNFPALFTPIVCVAGIGKNIFNGELVNLFIFLASNSVQSIVGVAGGATRAALTMHQARRNNMADVSAKDGSQETMSNLIGLLFNFVFVYAVTGNDGLIFVAFVILTMCHLYANYRCVNAVRMETFNQTRLHTALFNYLHTGRVPSVDHCNLAEPVVFPMTRQCLDVILGASLKSAIKSCEDSPENMFDCFRNESYILFYDRQRIIRNERGTAFIVVKDQATAQDQMKAMFHAELINYLAYCKPGTSTMSTELSTLTNEFYTQKEESAFSRLALIFINKSFPAFLESATSMNWKLDPVLFGADEWRIIS